MLTDGPVTLLMNKAQNSNTEHLQQISRYARLNLFSQIAADDIEDAERDIGLQSLIGKEFVFVPCCLKRHYFTATICVLEKKIQIFDSSFKKQRAMYAEEKLNAFVRKNYGVQFDIEVVKVSISC